MQQRNLQTFQHWKCDDNIRLNLQPEWSLKIINVLAKRCPLKLYQNMVVVFIGCIFP